MDKKSSIIIYYCPRCRWLLRAAYYAQELLESFSDELQGITLKPSETSGQFSIILDNGIIWDRKKDNGFPEIKALKQLIRDQVAPDKSLGHSDKS